MQFFWTSFVKDLSRWRRDPLTFVLWLGIPFLIGGLITLMMSGNGAQPNGLLLIADEDDSFVSGVFAQAFQQEGISGIITVQQVEQAEGLALINDGQGSALLIIPDGFGEAVFKQTPVELTLRKNPSQTILPGIIQETVEILVDAGFYLQAVFGEDLKTISGWLDGGGTFPGGEIIGALSERIQQRLEAVSSYIDPFALEVTVTEEQKKEPGPSLALLFLPGIILMSALFAAQALSGDLWAERRQGTLRRLSSSPRGALGFFAGKVAAAGLMVGLLTAIIIAAGFSYHDIGWAHVVPVLLWMTLSGITLFVWFAVLQMALPTQQLAGTITLILIFPLMMAGGSFFPIEVLPDWLQPISRLSPNGFMVTQLKNEMTASSAWAIGQTEWGVLLAFAAGGIFLAATLLNFSFAKR